MNVETNQAAAPAPMARKPEFWESMVPRPFFQHLRHYDDESGDILPTGGTTLAWRYFKDDNEVHLAAALCSSADIFCRSRGRLLAAGRLLSPAREIVAVDPALRELNDRDLRKAVAKLLDEFETRKISEWNMRRSAVDFT